MKKLAALLGLIFSLQTSAQTSTYTTYFNLEKPADGSVTWGSAVRSDLDSIDLELHVLEGSIDDHITDTTDAHEASAIGADPGATVCTTSDDVQDFLDCLDLNIGTITGGSVMTLNTDQTVTGEKTFIQAIIGDLTGDVTGNVTGNVVGNVTGNVTGNLTGNVTGNITGALTVSSGTLGSVYFAGASGLVSQDNANFFWDDTNNRLGLGTTGPSVQLHTTGGVRFASLGAGLGHFDANGVLTSSNVLLSEITSAADGNIPYGSSGTHAALTVGSSGQVLGSNGTIPAWQNDKAPLFATGTRASPTLITAGGGITPAGRQREIAFIAGNGGAINITANPQIVAGTTVGQELLLQGRHATNTVQLDDGTGVSLRGGTAAILAADSYIVLIWDGTNWTEASRSKDLIPATGVSAPDIQVLTGSGTYTTPASCLYLEIEMVGPGGGGAGSGTGGDGGSGNAGSANTTFGDATAAFGTGGTCANNVSGSGGTATLGTGTGIAIAGGGGAGGINNSGGQATGGTGCVSPFGNGGGTTANNNANNATGYGSGGGGGSNSGTTGAGGGCGGYIHKWITSSLSGTYSYVIGNGGSGGSAGSAGSTGSAGAAGTIIVKCHYQ